MSGRRQGRGTDKELMLRGSLFIKRRRCGKPNCKCVNGELHESPALTYRVEGRPRTIVHNDSDEAEVRAARQRYLPHATRSTGLRTLGSPHSRLASLPAGSVWV